VFDVSKDAPIENIFIILMHKFNADAKDNTGFKEILNRCPDYRRKAEITEADIRRIYREMGIRPTIEDRIDYVVQAIYEAKFGLGCIDLLNYDIGTIEEIELGLSGPGSESVRYQDRLKDVERTARYSKDAVHVMVSGQMIELKFLSFKTDNEHRRVIRNLIKCTAAGELTKVNPYKVVDAVDGRRITAARPGASDAWIAFVRKFDTVAKCQLDALYEDVPDGKRLVRVLRKLVNSGGSVVLLGPMGSGKTSAIRALFGEVPRDKSIRTIEDESFEIALRKHLVGRNVTSIRTTDYLNAEDALGLIKKTSGQILGMGELTTPDVEDMFLNLSKISEQTFTTAHHTDAEELIADLVNARLKHGYTSERLAELDVVRSLNFIVHLANRGGVRLVDYIDEVLVDDTENLPAGGDVIGALRDIRTQLGSVRTYKVVHIMRYDWEKEKYDILNEISEPLQEKYLLNCKFYGLTPDIDIRQLETVQTVSEKPEDPAKEDIEVVSETPVETAPADNSNPLFNY
jgi:Flp pilus assembly CpaF family ATPase